MGAEEEKTAEGAKPAADTAKTGPTATAGNAGKGSSTTTSTPARASSTPPRATTSPIPLTSLYILLVCMGLGLFQYVQQQVTALQEQEKNWDPSPKNMQDNEVILMYCPG